MSEELIAFGVFCARIKIQEADQLFFSQDMQDYMDWAKIHDPQAFKEGWRLYLKARSCWSELERSIA